MVFAFCMTHRGLLPIIAKDYDHIHPRKSQQFLLVCSELCRITIDDVILLYRLRDSDKVSDLKCIALERVSEIDDARCAERWLCPICACVGKHCARSFRQ